MSNKAINNHTTQRSSKYQKQLIIYCNQIKLVIGDSLMLMQVDLHFIMQILNQHRKLKRVSSVEKDRQLLLNMLLAFLLTGSYICIWDDL